MRQQWSVVAGLAMAVVGCGGRTTAVEDETGSGGAGVSGRSVGGSAASGEGGATPSGKGGATPSGKGGATPSGKGGATPSGKGGTAGSAPTLPESATLTMSSFVIEPGGEVYYCQNFANPFHATVDIGAFESHMSPGSHHLLLNVQGGTLDGPLTTCSGLTPPGGPYVSQRPDETLNYPSGVASELDASAGYMFQVHYLNAGAERVVPKAQVTLHRAKGAVTAHAHLLSSIALNIQVPPNGTGTAGGIFSPGESAHLFQLVGHMHRHGVRFQALLGSEILYDVDSWEAPPKTFSPARVLTASQQIAYTCTYKNDTSATLTFGESAATNEMCLLLGQYY